MNSRRTSEPSAASNCSTTTLDHEVYQSPTPVGGLCLTCAYKERGGDGRHSNAVEGEPEPLCHCVYAIAAARRQVSISIEPPPDEQHRHRFRPPKSASIPSDLLLYGDDDPTDENGNDWRRRTRRWRNSGDALGVDGGYGLDDETGARAPTTTMTTTTTTRRSRRQFISVSPIGNTSPSRDERIAATRSRFRLGERNWNSLSDDIASDDYDRLATGSDDPLVSFQRFPAVRPKKKTNGRDRWKSVTNFFRNFSLRQTASAENVLPEVYANGTEQFDRTRLAPPGGDGRDRLQFPDVFGDSQRRRRTSPSDRSPSDDGLMLPPVEGRVSPHLRIDYIRYVIRSAEETNQWEGVWDCYKNIFRSLPSISASFTMKTDADGFIDESCCVDMDKLFLVYDSLLIARNDIDQMVLRLIGSQLLARSLKASHDDLRALFCLLLNPQFDASSSCAIFAHLLRHVADVTDEQNHLLVRWLMRLELPKFSLLITRIQNFITLRHLSLDISLPPAAKSSWWIPSAMRVLALLNAANYCFSNMPRVSYIEFYNCSLDNIDLLSEYNAWQKSTTAAQHVDSFNFCQFPFVLSIAAKRTIIQKDSENQMLLMAHRTVVAKMQMQQVTDMDQLFLNITVRRSHLVSDSLNEIARQKNDLKKKLRVRFDNEPGVDLGGLTKEWFLLLVRKIFQPDYGMFTFDKSCQVYWFSTNSCENYLEYNLIGILMGLAVYNGIILDIHFPRICYQKLLSPAVVPYNDVNAVVGVRPVTIEDLRQVSPEVAKGLQELLDYDGNVEEDFGLTFQVTRNEFDQIVSHELKHNSRDIPVTNQNRQEYVSLYVDFVLNSSIYNQFKAFYHGFHSVCASNALIMLRPEEVELLVCGNPVFSLKKLADVTEYSGYSAKDETIRSFWEVVLTMPEELQKKLLLFATGSDRIPIGGLNEMNFRIVHAENSEMLPTSHTCFNQLILPDYEDKDVLRQKLTIAIQNAEGFGLK